MKRPSAICFCNTRWESMRFLLSPCTEPPPPKAVQFHRWINFHEPISKAMPIVPDGYFECISPNGIHPMFLEVDLGTEPKRTWKKKKTTAYLQLAISGEFQHLFHHTQFRVLVVASSERSLKSIRAVVAESTEKIFRFSAFEFINREGFL